MRKSAHPWQFFSSLEWKLKQLFFWKINYNQLVLVLLFLRPSTDHTNSLLLLSTHEKKNILTFSHDFNWKEI